MAKQNVDQLSFRVIQPILLKFVNDAEISRALTTRNFFFLEQVRQKFIHECELQLVKLQKRRSTVEGIKVRRQMDQIEAIDDVQLFLRHLQKKNRWRVVLACITIQKTWRMVVQLRARAKEREI